MNSSRLALAIYHERIISQITEGIPKTRNKANGILLVTLPAIQLLSNEAAEGLFIPYLGEPVLCKLIYYRLFM